MRNGQNKRMRGRNRRNHNPLTRVYESNGPDVKIRGTAHHIAEKYVQLARDAQTSGDPVAAESYLQHAEHYFRMIAVAQAQFAQQNPHHQQQQYVRSDGDPRDEFSDDEGDDMGPDIGQPQHPGMPGAPQPHYQPPQQQPQFRPPHQQHQPQQPQPNYQPQQHRRPDEPRDPGLPAFITGGQPGQPGGQPPGNGFDAEQGGDRGDHRSDRGDRGGRFGRRRRFRPRGPGDFEHRGDRPDFQPQGGPAAAPSSEPASAEPNAPKPAEPGE